MFYLTILITRLKNLINKLVYFKTFFLKLKRIEIFNLVRKAFVSLIRLKRFRVQTNVEKFANIVKLLIIFNATLSITMLTFQL